jgi:hypothetical protein
MTQLLLIKTCHFYALFQYKRGPKTYMMTIFGLLNANGSFCSNRFPHQIHNTCPPLLSRLGTGTADKLLRHSYKYFVGVFVFIFLVFLVCYTFDLALNICNVFTFRCSANNSLFAQTWNIIFVVIFHFTIGHSHHNTNSKDAILQ